MSLPLVQDSTKFHMSINVTDLSRALKFYRILFGCEPSKAFDDYAKFDLTDPPTVFSLVPGPPRRGGPLSHIGLRQTSADAIWAIQRRLDTAGYPTRTQLDVSGCYARQDKIWVNDPDETIWEVYVVKEDLDLKGDAPAKPAMVDLPAVVSTVQTKFVVYKGPFREVVDGAGRVFSRGQRVAVPGGNAAAFLNGLPADQFVLIQDQSSSTCG